MPNIEYFLGRNKDILPTIEGMTKKSDEVKKLLQNWLTEYSYEVQDITNMQKTQEVKWILKIGKRSGIIAFSTKNNPNCLRIQCNIGFSEEHRKKIIHLSNEKYNEFVLNQTDRLTSYDVDWNFEHDKKNPKQINALIIRKFLDYDAIDKNKVLQLITRQIIIQKQMIRAISITLNNHAITLPVSNADDKIMYG